jgi:hypothetical protein
MNDSNFIEEMIKNVLGVLNNVGCLCGFFLITYGFGL